MNKFKLSYLLGVGVVAALLTSCAKESIDPDNDVNPDGKYTINYAVQVVPVGDVERGLLDASVTIQTQNGVTTKQVGSDGIAVFENLDAGTISGYVTATGYASVNFKAFASNNNIDVNTNNYVSSTIYLPKKNAGVAGRIYADWDLDGNTTLTDAGNFQAVDLNVRVYPTGAYPMGTGDGALTQVSLDVNTYASVSASNGTFLIENLPNTDLGYLTATLKMNPVSMVDPVSSATIVWTYGPTAISLVPGETLQLGDIYVP